MWRRASSHLQTLVTWRSALNINRSVVAGHRTLRNRAFISGSSPSAFQNTVRLFSSDSASMKKSVEDVMPIATGHEREELEAELQGRKVVDIDNFEGPFGTKESPAIIKSYFDKRITGCPGGEGEDEHDVVWFWLEKGKPHECPVCGQYFELEVVGPGGPPDGHGDDDHHH